MVYFPANLISVRRRLLRHLWRLWLTLSEIWCDLCNPFWYSCAARAGCLRYLWSSSKIRAIALHFFALFQHHYFEHLQTIVLSLASTSSLSGTSLSIFVSMSRSIVNESQCACVCRGSLTNGPPSCFLIPSSSSPKTKTKTKTKTNTKTNYWPRLFVMASSSSPKTKTKTNTKTN